MKLWIDAQLSPLLARWLSDHFSIEATALKDLGLRDASDLEIFDQARKVNAVIMSKDADFPQLAHHRGTPPKIIWITCGNTSNHNLKRILETTLREAIRLLEAGEDVVEIAEIS